MNEDSYYTPLDRELQDLAALDWVAFVRLVGEDSIVNAKVCLLKTKGKSINQIGLKFNRSKGWARHIMDNKCNCTNYGKKS